MQNEKPITVYSAIAANLFIAGTKYVVASITGSSAMLAEAIHSTADTGNELLLLLGLRRSRKPPDKAHPLGHGRELYFWGLIVALMLFSTGSGVAIYEGLTRLSHPEELKSVGWNYVVLGFAFLADGTSWTIAFRQLWKQKKDGESFWRSVTQSKDPSVFIVFGEDSADVLGLLIAFFGVFLGQRLHSRLPDVIASILVGLVLAVVAIYLAYESKSLLIGESADSDVVRDIQKFVESHPAVLHLERPLSIHLSPHEIILTLNVQFKRDLQASELIGIIDELKEQIRQQHQDVAQIFIEADKPKGEKKAEGRD
jgi:cation diffusion facilitator family transporter